jgi:hypothetical protein
MYVFVLMLLDQLVACNLGALIDGVTRQQYARA